jgi:crotonobetainyl-CoA:carnitine CoA-transferase CaiB-like acyl-CoA transferase
MAPGPLSDVRVLDIASFMAAPMAAMWLGDFGADVVKVEHPNGDPIRSWGNHKDGVALFWKMVGRNKRSIAIDLHEEQGQELLLDLCTVADVVVENFRPGTLDRWNIGYDRMRERNPGLVLLSVSAFGQTGPNSPRAGFGTLAEAMSGYADITGQADGPPTLPSFALADSITGLCGAYAVMVALHERAVSSGEGQHIDVALYEPMLTVLSHIFVDYDQIGHIARRLGSRLPLAAPRNVFRTGDDAWVAMSCSAQSVFERACAAIGRDELIHDERFATNRDRIEHVDEIEKYFGDWIASKSQDEVLQRLTDAGAAAAPIYTVADVFEDPHFQARENLVEVPDAELGTIRMQNVTPKLSRTPGTIRHAGPRTGEHAEEILRDWLGLGTDALERLRSDGVTGAGQTSVSATPAPEPESAPALAIPQIEIGR